MNYKSLLKNLLPRGPIWRNINDMFDLFLEALAVEPARVHTRVDDLWRETFPATAVELLPEFEAMALLPDEMPAIGATNTQRQAVVNAKITANYSGQSDAFWIAYALKMGIVITISHPYAPFRCGVGHCGDSLNSEGGVFVWRVTIVSSPDDDTLARMKLAFERLKAAETEIEYA